MVCTNAEWRRERFNFAIRVVQHKTETTRTGQQLSLSKYEQRGMFWIFIEFFFLLRSVATHSQKELLTDWARLYTHFDENHLFSYAQSHRWHEETGAPPFTAIFPLIRHDTFWKRLQYDMATGEADIRDWCD